MLKSQVITYLKNLKMLLGKKQDADFSIERQMQISIIGNCIIVLRELEKENKGRTKKSK